MGPLPGCWRHWLPARPPKDLHHRLICLDTHLDTPMSFARTGWDILKRHGGDIDSTQVDYPRMVEGGLTGGFFAIYTPQGPQTAEGFLAMRDAAFLRAAEIREMVAAHPLQFELAFEPEDAARIAGRGKRIVFQSIENSSPLGTDVSLLRVFYKLGVRMAGRCILGPTSLAIPRRTKRNGTGCRRWAAILWRWRMIWASFLMPATLRMMSLTR